MKNRIEFTYHIGKILKKHRKARGWDQNDLAEKANIARETISKIERGKCDPQISTLRAIAGAFGINPAELLAEIIITPFGKAKNFGELIDLLKDKDEKIITKVIALTHVLLGNEK